MPSRARWCAVVAVMATGLAMPHVAHAQASSCLRVPAPSALVTSVYGWRLHPVTRQWRLHRGVDLRAAIGEPLKATHAGVVQVSASASGGNEVRIIGDNGVVTRYLHLTRSAVPPGRHVTAGDEVAISGNTGEASAAPHLHLEVYGSTGADQNPEPLLCPAPGRKAGATVSNGFPVTACSPAGGHCAGGVLPVASQVPVSGNEPAAKGRIISAFDDVSLAELISAEIAKRHGNPDWYRLEAERSPQALLVEYNHIQALRQVLRAQSNETSEIVSTLLGARLARKAHDDMAVRLGRQREVTAKAHGQ